MKVFAINAASIASLTIITKVRKELSLHPKVKYWFEDLSHKIISEWLETIKSLNRAIYQPKSRIAYA